MGAWAMEQVHFHIDMDAFYVSVERLDDESLIGRPVVVGGMASQRGVVASCSYEARARGVRSAMPMGRALRLCPDAAVIPPRMDRYRQVSAEIMMILRDFSPVVQQVSVDEAFLDMTGTERAVGPPEEAARLLKERIRKDVGVPSTVGIAPNRYIAKMVSASAKPDGLLRISPGGEVAFVDTLSLRRLWGVGPALHGRLEASGFRTPRDVRGLSPATLAAVVGEGAARYLRAACAGADPGILSDQPVGHSISSERTLAEDTADREEIRRLLLALSHDVGRRLIAGRLESSKPAVKIRYSDFHTVSAQMSVATPVAGGDALFAAALALFEKRWTGRPIRLAGVGVFEVHECVGSGRLFADAGERQLTAEQAVVSILGRHPNLTIGKAALMHTRREGG